MGKICRDNRYILLNSDIGNEGITTRLLTYGLKCKVMLKKCGDR